MALSLNCVVFCLSSLNMWVWWVNSEEVVQQQDGGHQQQQLGIDLILCFTAEFCLCPAQVSLFPQSLHSVHLKANVN